MVEDDPGYLIQRVMSSSTTQQLESTRAWGGLAETPTIPVVGGSGLQGQVRLELNPESFIMTKVLRGNKVRLLSAPPKPQDIRYTEGTIWVTRYLSIVY